MKTSVSLRRIFSHLPFLILFLSLNGTALAELPELFDGELAVCKSVEGAMAQGEPLAIAILSAIEGIQTNDPNLLPSIRRTVLHNSIVICGYDPTTVIMAGYLAGLPLDLVAGSAVAAGVAEEVVVLALVVAGADAKLVAEALKLVDRPVALQTKLPPVILIGSGLGQASPFNPSP